MRRSVRLALVTIVLVCAGVGFTESGAKAADGASPQAGGGQRGRIAAIARDLEQQASAIARDSFDHFRGWNGTISDQEQAILFTSEAFAASCRLFLRLTGEQADYYRAENVRTNLYNAFTYLARAFSGLEQEMRRGNVMPYAMSDARRTLSLMEREFSRWAVPDNLAYLDGKYVQARDATVYLIEKVDVGSYARRPFSSLESLFRFNYDRNRGSDPWKFRVQVPDELLQKMRVGAPIELTFEGQMVMLAGGGRNRGVYRIEDGRKRVIARPDLLNRYGGWARVFEVPREVIDRYPDGTP
ncbi:MAG: hypothetical protein ACM3NQ_10245, partial [Bacteroidales bacterium]